MSFEIEGKLIEKYEIQQVTDKFRKREFVIEKVENTNGREFKETIIFQLTQDRCSEIESAQLNDMVKVTFNIKGRRWDKNGTTKYFNNLEAWRINVLTANDNAGDIPPPPDVSEADLQPLDDNNDDLPF